jgi:mono/diheme cytochrome c family protein
VIRPIWAAPALLVLMASASARAADDGPGPAALLFSERCSTCHTIGGGVKVGPDLLGVIKRRDKAWFARFVRGPARLIDGGDPTAAGLFAKFAPVKMPDQPLTDGEVDSVWAYFTTCNDKGGCLPASLGPRWGTDASDEEVTRGRELFTGVRRLARGGAPCFACHNVRGEGPMGGGTLAADLTFAYARLGEKGMAPLLAEMTTPVMATVYGAAPLGADEQYALKAYLAHLARDGAPPRRDRDFLALGLEGMGIVLGFFTLRAGRGRLS